MATLPAVDTAAFLGCTQIDDRRWRLPVVPGVCSGYGTLFGGCALGVAALAMQAAARRPLVWATAQFVAQSPIGETVDFEVVLPAAGRAMTQARVVGRVDGREIIVVSGALGARDLDETGMWATPVDVAPPDACPPRVPRFDGESVASRLDMRLALGRPDHDHGDPTRNGRSALWARVPGGLELDAAWLAVLGDFVPFGTWQSLRTPVNVSSLDNTMRYVDVRPTPWVLCDIRVAAVHRGIAHGEVYLWSSDGHLLAVASQTTQIHRRGR